MTQKGHGVIRGHSDLLYDRKGHCDLCGRFDLVHDPKKVNGSSEVAMTYFMYRKVILAIDIGLDLRVKHLIWQVTTDVQATL